MESRRLLAPLTLLRRAPGFRLLFLATFGSSLGSLLAVIALAIDVKDRTDSGAWVAALLLANLVPGILLGLVAGIALSFFRPAVYAGLPNLVESADLAPANSLLQTVDNATWAIGPL